MKKIYLKPEMELTECCMLKTAICSYTDGDNLQNDMNDAFAPERKRPF